MKITVSKGSLLIADPSILNDDSFKRAIVLLAEHSKESSVGFIMNRPTSYAISELLPDIESSFKVYEGGPVEQDNLYFVHRIPHLLSGSKALSNGLYWGGDFDELKELLNNQSVNLGEIRFFLGYSGWTAMQLEEELLSKFWFVANNTYDNVLTIDDDKVWKEQLLKKGGEYKIWANAPNDLQSN